MKKKFKALASAKIPAKSARFVGSQLKRSIPKTRKGVRRRAYAFTFIFVVLLSVFSYFTNPFAKFSVIVDPFRTVEVQDNQFVLQEDSALFVRGDVFFRRLALLKSGWHIVSGRFVGGPKAKQGTIDEIISEIHQLRFNSNEPYLISGDHFSVLYPRSLGIFYNSLLDPRTALDENDWKNRQLIYLKTVAYILQVYEQSDHLSTTIVPVAPRSVVLLNVYAPPSDTLYSILYALSVLKDENEILSRYPYHRENQEKYSLQTKSQADKLLSLHLESLKRHYSQYVTDVYDPQTGLVRKDTNLSSAKDIVFRQSSLYDNVIFWKTSQLAQQLGIIESDPEFLIQYKKRILQAFWLDDQGYFLEELSDRAVAEKYYSSDWLIMYMTGFLDPHNPDDLYYLTKTVEYIQRNAIDQPFGLQYHPEPHPGQLVPVVRYLAPAYGSTAIWSNWGQEYIKLLTQLAVVTGDELYLQQANQQLTAYSFNIKRYQGYPEVYDKNGDFFRQTLYKSVRQTGWVVSYEQARAMYEDVRKNWGFKKEGMGTENEERRTKN